MVVTDFGTNQIGNLITGVNTNSVTHSGVGSGTTAPTDNDTDLETAIGSRKAITDRFVFDNVVHLDTFHSSSENNGTVTEAIIATSSSGANAVARKLTAEAFEKTSERTMVTAWTITITAVPDS